MPNFPVDFWLTCPIALMRGAVSVTHNQMKAFEMSDRLVRAHSHFPGRSFNALICKDIVFEPIYCRLNKINKLWTVPGKWECAHW